MKSTVNKARILPTRGALEADGGLGVAGRVDGASRPDHVRPVRVLLTLHCAGEENSLCCSYHW